MNAIRLSLALGCLSIHLLWSQAIDYQSISVEDGLSQSQVTCILQDRLGLMWLGTHDGLNLYDGHEFTVYRTNPLDSTSISNNWITSIAEAVESGHPALWVGTSYGLNRFDRATERFERFLHNSADGTSIPDDRILDILATPDSAIWIGTTGGISRWHPSSDMFSNIVFYGPGDIGNITHALAMDYKRVPNVLWIGSGLGLHFLEFNPLAFYEPDLVIDSTFQLVRFQQEFIGSIPNADPSITDLCFDNRGQLWVATTYNGAHVIDIRQNTVEKIDLIAEAHHAVLPYQIAEDQRIKQISSGNNNIIWIATFGGGLWKRDTKSQQMSVYSEKARYGSRIASDFIKSVYEDINNDLWIGTEGSGLAKLNFSKSKFRTITSTPDGAGLAYRSVLSVHEDVNDVIWIGTIAGLNRYDPISENITLFSRDPGNSQTIRGNVIQFITPTRQDKHVLWLGTGLGIDRLDIRSETFAPLATANDHGHEVVVRSFLEDSKGRIWEGLHGGFRISEMDEYGVRGNSQLQWYSNISREFAEAITMFLYEDSNGAVWIGTTRGLLKYDQKDFSISIPITLSKVHVDNEARFFTSVSEDPRADSQVLWFGTRSGVYQFDVSTGASRAYREIDGLPNNIVAGMESDEAGNLWISTFRGLARLNPVSGAIKSYDLHDGLQSYEFNTGAHHIGTSGSLYFGGIHGLNIIDPTLEMTNQNKPPVILTDFRVYNKSVPIENPAPNNDDNDSPITLPIAISFCDSVSFSAEHNVFSIEFAALDYTAPHLTQYEFMLEGFRDEWIQNGHQRTATFTNLDPGEYLFRVRAANADGIWSEDEASLHISILPRWWESPLAFAAYTVLLLLTILSLWRFQHNRTLIKRQLELEQIEAEKLKELDRLKSRFFANISHEFRTPLTLILGPIERMLNGEFDGNAASQYPMIMRNGKRLLRLINQILDLSRLEAGKLVPEPSYCNLVAITANVVSSFESMAKRKNVELVLNPQHQHIPVYVDAAKIEDVIVNLLSNALKYTGEGGRITVVCEELPDGTDLPVRLSITDTGIGIPERLLPHIFDRYFRAHTDSALPGGFSDSEHGETGAGIGLAYARELIELHKGTIEVESELNEGTRFIITLPGASRGDETVSTVVPADDDAQISQEPPLVLERGVDVGTDNGSSETDSEITILIIEDNYDLSQFISDSLNPSYSVLRAFEGRSGVETALSGLPDIIICDIIMPIMNGLEVCRALKTDPRTSHIPIILLTALAEDEDKIRGLEQGADDYLAKPFNAKELSIRVKNLLELRSRIQAKYRHDVLTEPEPFEGLSLDESFLQAVCAQIQSNIGDPDFAIEQLAKLLSMSRSNLHHKLHSLTGLSPSKFVRRYRLKVAAQMLANRQGTVTDIAFNVGFGSHSYFTARFREQYGVTPNEYMRQHARDSDSV